MAQRIKPKSQSEKRIDALALKEGGVGVFVNATKTAERFNDYSEAALTKTAGEFSHAEGKYTEASGWCAHAGGSRTVANKKCAHAEGELTEASGDCSHAEGSGSVASGNNSHAEGTGSEATSNACHAEGNGTLSSGGSSHSEGFKTEALGSSSHAEGSNSVAKGAQSHAEGDATEASGNNSHTGGRLAKASGFCSFAHGWNVIADENNQTAVGQANIPSAAMGRSGIVFTVGCGHHDSSGTPTRDTAFFVHDYGSVYALGQYLTIGADYAEYYEWLDDNLNNEDRTGLFVTVDGRKIKFANSNANYILGVVSATPSIVGNAHESNWKNRFKKDIFGRYIRDEEGHKITSDEYDETQKYTPRSLRPEYAPVGTHGQLIVIDDGTCEINSYCGVADGGIGTKCDDMEKVYRGLAFRVIERLDETHIRIVIK